MTTHIAARLRYLRGDATAPVTDDGRPAIIAHICNDRGMWGAGFTRALDGRWQAPGVHYRAWSRSDKRGDDRFGLGEVAFVVVAPGITVANMIAQKAVRSIRNPSPIRYAELSLCLRKVATHALSLGAHVHMPRIGTGLAGGRWEMIEPMVKARLVALDVPVTVYDFP